MYGKMQEPGLIEIIPLICTLSMYSQYAVLLILDTLKVYRWEWLQWLTA